MTDNRVINDAQRPVSSVFVVEIADSLSYAETQPFGGFAWLCTGNGENLSFNLLGTHLVHS